MICRNLRQVKLHGVANCDGAQMSLLEKCRNSADEINGTKFA